MVTQLTYHQSPLNQHFPIIFLRVYHHFNWLNHVKSPTLSSFRHHWVACKANVNEVFSVPKGPAPSFFFHQTTEVTLKLSAKQAGGGETWSEPADVVGMIDGWLVVWNMAFIFPNSWDDPIWQKSFLFFRRVGIPPTREWLMEWLFFSMGIKTGWEWDNDFYVTCQDIQTSTEWQNDSDDLTQADRSYWWTWSDFIGLTGNWSCETKDFMG